MNDDPGPGVTTGPQTGVRRWVASDLMKLLLRRLEAG